MQWREVLSSERRAREMAFRVRGFVRVRMWMWPVWGAGRRVVRMRGGGMVVERRRL